MDYLKNIPLIIGIAGIGLILSGANFDTFDRPPVERKYNFQGVDSIVAAAIQQRAFPGCQILVMHQGATVLQKSYGYLTYDSLVSVTDSTLYDVASLTKVTATTLMIMDLYDRGEIDLDERLACYLPEFVATNKQDITLRQLLSHHAGLQPYIPFWDLSLKADLIDPIPNHPKLNGFGQIDNVVMRDSLKSWIIKSPLIQQKGKPYYKYSDVGFIILQMVAEKIAREDMESYLTKRYYGPMGLRNTHFNPLTKGVSRSLIAPTEFEIDFRNGQVWGNVHDRNAAILGGVAGHAGLFSNAGEMAKISELFLERGRIDGLSFFSPATFYTFNRRYYSGNRRALGFDKRNAHVSAWTSSESFGHKGFTGTMIWADPLHELVYVFLSNRIYPNATNRKLITQQVRSKVQDVIYEKILVIN